MKSAVSSSRKRAVTYLGVLGNCCLEQLLPSTQQRTDAALYSAVAPSVHVI